MRAFRIGNRVISDDMPPYCIAEVGHNHQGNVSTAKRIIDIAAAAGFDAIKLQKRDNPYLFTRAAYDETYNSENAFGLTYGAHREALELSRADYQELKDYTNAKGLDFFATAFDEPSATFLYELGVPAIKVASGDLQSIPLLRYIAALRLPVILSTGGGTMEDVERAVETVDWQPGQLCLLQCTAAYPCPPEELNLRVITTYRERFPDVVCGLSDHFSGILSGALAVSLHASVLEKHVTWNRSAKGSDHGFSLETEGQRRFIRDVHRVWPMLGDGVKRPFESEGSGMRKMRKSIVVWRDLPSGHELESSDFQYKSPGGGILPYRTAAYIGRRLRQPVTADHVLRDEDVEEEKKDVQP